MNCYKCQTPLPDDSHFCLSCGADVSGEDHRRSGTMAMDHDPELFAKLQAELGDEYILERELGRGGMAVVFLGRDSRLGRKVAVKVLPPELTYGGGSMIERFKREAQTAAKLDHPNIIPVYRVAPGGKLFWYVMKYLDGKGLDHILDAEGQLPVDRAVEIVAQVAGALDYAHRHHVVHRDVKPANVIVDADERVTVTDFGIAKALDANTLTASGSIIGTPYYMSPEQCKGKRVGPAADQYSLAVMTYQMLGGHVPFTGDSAVEIVHKHVADPVPPLGVLRPELPEKLVQVVEKALAKEAEDRFVTVAEFAKALKATSQGLDVTIAPPGKPGAVRLSKTALVSPVPGALRTAKRTWRDRKGLWIGGSLAAVVVAGGVAAVLLVPQLQEMVGLRPAADANQVVAALPPPDSTPPAAQDTTPTQPTEVSAQPPGGTGATSAAATGLARVRLRGVPSGATVTADGRRVRGSVAEVEGGRSHVLRVTMEGYEPWSRTVSPGPGEELPVTVTLRPAGAPTTAAAPAPTVQAPAVSQAPVQPPAQPPAATGTARITIGSMPATATMYINSQPMPRNPMRDYEVPAGTVTIRFVVTDSTGASWEQTITRSVQAGETRNFGRIPLTRP